MQLEAALEQVELRIKELLANSHDLVRKYTAIVGETRGKLIRPRLMLTSATMFGQVEPRTVINCAACCELLHIASLIHDDVIDEANSRRGKATLNNRFGNEIAVIVGDYLLALVFKGLSAERDFNLVNMLLNTSQELGMGVLAEIINRDDLSMTEEKYFEIIYLKTAALFSLCSAMGAYLGGADEAAVAEAAEYGKQLGLGFQVVDDILDVTADESVTGKPSFNDLREGRITLPLIHAAGEAPEPTKELVANFQRNSSNGASQTIREHLLRHGSLLYAYKRAASFLKCARQSASGLISLASAPDLDHELQQIEAKVLGAVPAVATQVAN